jgi:hypothetical protein
LYGGEGSRNDQQQSKVPGCSEDAHDGFCLSHLSQSIIKGIASNAGLQLRRAISIQSEGNKLLEKHAIAPSAARLCYAGRCQRSTLFLGFFPDAVNFSILSEVLDAINNYGRAVTTGSGLLVPTTLVLVHASEDIYFRYFTTIWANNILDEHFGFTKGKVSVPVFDFYAFEKCIPHDFLLLAANGALVNGLPIGADGSHKCHSYGMFSTAAVYVHVLKVGFFHTKMGPQMGANMNGITTAFSCGARSAFKP